MPVDEQELTHEPGHKSDELVHDVVKDVQPRDETGDECPAAPFPPDSSQGFREDVRLLIAERKGGFSGEGIREDFVLVIRFTRHWIHYGWIGVTVFVTLVGAVKGLLAK